MTRFAGLLCLLLSALPQGAAALNSPESSLTLDVDAVSLHGEWKVRLLDLSSALQLDTQQGTVTWPRSSTAGRISRRTWAQTCEYGPTVPNSISASNN